MTKNIHPLFLAGAFLSATGLVLVLFVFNLFAFTMIFGYFNDVVYEVIFFFLTVAVSINIGVKLLELLITCISE